MHVGGEKYTKSCWKQALSLEMISIASYLLGVEQKETFCIRGLPIFRTYSSILLRTLV